MPFILIKGTFHILGKQPDGDSIRFKADKKSDWKKLTTENGAPVTADITSTDQTAQLRIESIDALESHYKGNHQPKAQAHDATLYLLKLIGFKNVNFGPSGIEVTSVDNDGIKGYILTRYIDNPLYKRPVSFVFTGTPPAFPGGKDKARLYADRLKNSVNYKMMRAGFVYPVFYNTLFYDLRNEFKKALAVAKKSKKNIWHPVTGDRTNKGFKAIKLVDLEDKEIVFPKLFRRLSDFHRAKNLGYSKTLKNFKEKFLPPKGDVVEIMSLNHTTDALDFLIDVISPAKMRLKYLPEDLKFFQPKPKTN